MVRSWRACSMTTWSLSLSNQPMMQYVIKEVEVEGSGRRWSWGGGSHSSPLFILFCTASMANSFYGCCHGHRSDFVISTAGAKYRIYPSGIPRWCHLDTPYMLPFTDMFDSQEHSKSRIRRRVDISTNMIDLQIILHITLYKNYCQPWLLLLEKAYSAWSWAFYEGLACYAPKWDRIAHLGALRARDQ